ncbi:TCR/Tet family MFS transporter [Shimia thalassica]|uniref:TCR/Tet family MFS transporter n=1 Tax=Shimia thalassica TaxID=1715693 RepID=UPI0026E3D47B|nr:TCR/Tet family MFS transporter [Shimia thalassica]MDO6479156.1 TCR/Tet family MFS transporter [Shimia thalassica]MDO6482183.1 TCR/Tet family MFS transporter [Shimia thalassica]MDO6796944.1 TCR/Tet family MFS transporter [Shimia thalassica]MDP2580963.1 TCR/Tet family MFS transporter [Shimia thalassica]
MRTKLPVIFIFMTVVIDSMGIGLIMPVMPDLIQELTGESLADAAIWGGVLSAAFALMQFLFGPVIGNLSDRFGRRPVLLISLVVMALDYVVMAVAGSIWLLFAGRIVGGITAATHSTASAYMADISAPDEKARNFGLIGAAFGVGFVFGPALGGLLAEFGTRAPFWGAAVLAAMNAALGWYVLKETVTDKIRRPFNWRRANPLGALLAVTKLPGLASLLLVFFCYQVATAVYPAIWSYFTAERFGWSPGMIGVSLAAFGLGFAIVQGGLVAPSIKRFGHRGTVALGLAIEVVTLCFLGVVNWGALVLAAVPFAALGALGMPALQGIMSRRVADDAQGELQGVLTSLMSLATIMSPLIMTQTFAYFSRPDATIYMPGAPFLLSAALLICGLVVFFRSSRRRS